MPAIRLAPSELAAFDLAEGIEDLSRQVRYMPARGLPCVMWMRAAHALPCSMRWPMPRPKATSS